MRLTAAIHKEDDWFVARCLEVEVASQGKSVDDALSNLKEALELFFEDSDAGNAPEPCIIKQLELADRA